MCKCEGCQKQACLLAHGVIQHVHLEMFKSRGADGLTSIVTSMHAPRHERLIVRGEECMLCRSFASMRSR
jgi:hypothetical protein